MARIWQTRKAAHLIKVFTHIAAVILILMSNTIKDIPYLVSLILVLLSASYFRQFFLIAKNKPVKYIWVTIGIELACIIGMGFIDQSGMNLLFLFACISETVINIEFKYSGLLLVAPYILSRCIIDTIIRPYGNVADILIDILIVRGVPIVFVAGTSYFVRAQVKEREKVARINKELEEAYKNLIDASAAAEQLSIEKERLRMAREIHDTLAHTLTTLIVQLEVCKKLAAPGAGRLAEELEKAQELTRDGLNDVKRTIKSLRPQALEEKPFFESILDFINNTMNNTEVHILLDSHLPHEFKLPAKLEIPIFRLIQESITNSIRHGHADEIQITMNLSNVNPDSGAVLVRIRDNGTGCHRIKKGFGLSGIQERVEAENGSVDFTTAMGNGFETRVSLPLKEA